MNKTIETITVLLTSLICFESSSSRAQPQSRAQQTTPIPMDQLGAAAGKQYQGDGLSMNATPNGALLRCVFQRLEGEATAEGLWLRSTAEGASAERFRVMATKVGRDTSSAPLDVWTTTDPFTWMQSTLPSVGAVRIAGKVARYIRDTLTEEYSVSMDGVRQDFIIEQRPTGEGELRVQLDVTGAKVEPLVHGARLTLDGSGRRLAYHRLSVSDSRGQELKARFEVTDANRMTVVVDDASAVYPVRIDPTFSDADWVSMGGIPGANGVVWATTVDGSGNLYIGGDFRIAGEAIANRIAKWDGSSWSALGLGMNATVYSLAVSGSDVYAGGIFDAVTNSGGAAVTVNGIAKWDGRDWSALGSGMDYFGLNSRIVYALAMSGTDLYAGGFFNTAGSNAANNVAKWNGSSWSALGSGRSQTVRALVVFGGDVYAGGEFSGGIAKWNGSTWSALGTGMNGLVYALAVNGTDLYAGGDFTMAGGVSANRIAKWNGSSWAALGSGINQPVYGLAVNGMDVYAGGVFTNAGGVSASRIAKWDGSSWSALGSGMNDDVYALATSGGDLFAGGYFYTAGNSGASRIAKWNGGTWSGLGLGLGGYFFQATVYALAVSGGDLYLGGFFKTAGNDGGTAVNSIAKWDGSSWSSLGLGLNSDVSALAVSGTNVYVGGFFTTATNAGGIPVTVNRIAKWDGSNWPALGSGMNDSVSCLALSGNDVYAGGRFIRATNTGGVPVTVNGIAKWDGTTWLALGSGMNSSVQALATLGNDVYAGGANRVAKWDGSNWSTLGLGMDGFLNALVVAGGDLYAGGVYLRVTNSGGATVRANSIAKWNGSTWSALGEGMSSGVTALAASGSNLYVGGVFLVASNSGGIAVAVNRIAKWDGSTWSALGSGLSGSVQALTVSDTTLYVGGSFVTAGGKVSASIAKATIGGVEYSGQLSGLAHSPVTGLSFTFLAGTIGQSYRIQTSSSLAVGSWTDLTNFTYTGPIVITDASAGSGTNKFFRAVTP